MVSAIVTDLGATELAPFCYENWQAATNEHPSSGAYEHLIFTDSQIIGTAELDYGPYQLLNTIAAGDRTHPAIVLRWEEHRTNPFDPELLRQGLALPVIVAHLT